MARTNVKRKPARKDNAVKERIVIDEAKGLIFGSEDELYNHFLPQIEKLENEYFAARKEADIPEPEFTEYEELLGQLLEDPDEVWEDEEALPGTRIYNYIGYFTSDGENFSYIAVVHRTGDTPTFVFLHFPTRDQQMIESYRRGRLLFDRIVKEVEQGAVDGDALSEGDDLAVGLYKAMLKVRGEKDIPEDQFRSYEELREETIEEPDEIWRSNDFAGNILVTFIKEFADQDTPDLHYIVVTVEDMPSNSHALLFSFPTRDRNLVDRYRHGENLQAEEVVQEASH